MSLALDIFMQTKKKAAANSKAIDSAPKYVCIATLHVMAVCSLDLGKLRAYL